MKLMPSSSFRWCRAHACGRRWWTANPGKQDCPFCASTAPDASNGWPHQCSEGHAAQHGGDCTECKQDKPERATSVQAKEWVNR